MVCFLVLALLIAVITPAHAYVDAGSGSYMLQMSLAGVLAAVFSIKVIWQRIRTFAIELFSRRPRNESRSAV